MLGALLASLEIISQPSSHLAADIASNGHSISLSDSSRLADSGTIFAAQVEGMHCIRSLDLKAVEECLASIRQDDASE